MLTRKELADSVGLGEVTMGKVMKIDDNAPEAVRRALDSGELSVDRAYRLTKQITDLPEEEREEAAELALELERAKREIREKDAEIDRRGEIAKSFSRAFEKAIQMEVSAENIAIWTECARMRPGEIEDNIKEADELCREYGLSVIEEENPARALSYAEWLRQSRGQPTFRAMLDADLREAIEDANDLGHFFLLMEHRGWEIRHGSRLGYCLRGQERYMVPERKNPTFSEEGIRAAIEGNLAAIEAGRRPIIVERPRYHPYPKGRKYSGFLALYAHYLYVHTRRA